MDADELLFLCTNSLQSLLYWGVDNLIYFRRVFCSVRFLIKFFPFYGCAPRLRLSIRHLQPHVDLVRFPKSSLSSLDSFHSHFSDSGLEFDSTSSIHSRHNNHLRNFRHLKGIESVPPNISKTTKICRSRTSQRITCLPSLLEGAKSSSRSLTRVHSSSSKILPEVSNFNQPCSEGYDSLFQSIYDSEPTCAPMQRKRNRTPQSSCNGSNFSHHFTHHRRQGNKFGRGEFSKKSKHHFQRDRKLPSKRKNNTRIENLKHELDTLRGELAKLVLIQERKTIFQHSDVEVATDADNGISHNFPKLDKNPASLFTPLVKSERIEFEENNSILSSFPTINSGSRGHLTVYSGSAYRMDSEQLPKNKNLDSHSDNEDFSIMECTSLMPCLTPPCGNPTTNKLNAVELIAKALKAKFCNVRYELDRQESPRN